ncbi:G-protein coupled receptor 4-like [Girardinichthys multiradiatus]|uniref:G-protein coupled receptor 4-like n=1 Tax=Girardinichthys multiradiatus TaxID=208333 RepID=UPI001FAE38F3|nr:G-protein coupled receptor 4-like [Girardinichthys multiradiatus]
MEEFYINKTNLSRGDDFNIKNHSAGHSTEYNFSFYLVSDVVQLFIICAGLPLTLVAIVAVYCLMRKDHVVPVYIINLQISDLIQLCCMTSWKVGEYREISYYIYIFAEMVSVGFMVCISLERYLVIVKPLWYRYRRNIKTFLMVCVVVWMVPLIYVIPLYCQVDFQVVETFFAIFHLLPLPLFIFFLVGTIKALSAARSVPADEKRRIVAILVALLLIYTLVFVPSIIWSLVEGARENKIFHGLAFTLLNVSPLLDLTMYLLIRKGAIDKILKSLCCCKIPDDLQTNSVDIDNVSVSCNEPI